MAKTLILLLLTLIAGSVSAAGQKPDDEPTKEPPKKANVRPATKAAAKEPFEKASIETMREQCVKFETEKGLIEMEMFPESAPESVRNFLNLVALGAFDTTTFSRVVPGFVIQGGNVATGSEKSAELFARSQKRIPDEPNQIRHERGILSMARAGESNSASSNFFILVSTASRLDGTFSAFGRVTRGMEVVDAINKMPVEGERPLKPVRLTKASIIPCAPKTEAQSN